MGHHFVEITGPLKDTHTHAHTVPYITLTQRWSGKTDSQEILSPSQGGQLMLSFLNYQEFAHRTLNTVKNFLWHKNTHLVVLLNSPLSSLYSSQCWCNLRRWCCFILKHRWRHLIPARIYRIKLMRKIQQIVSETASDVGALVLSFTRGVVMVVVVSSFSRLCFWLVSGLKWRWWILTQKRERNTFRCHNNTYRM